MSKDVNKRPRAVTAAGAATQGGQFLMHEAGYAVETFTFAVYPADFGDAFESFLIDVPTTGGQDAAARRAYFTAMARLSGVAEPEEFSVCVWEDGKPGALVTSGGVTT